MKKRLGVIIAIVLVIVAILAFIPIWIPGTSSTMVERVVKPAATRETIRVLGMALDQYKDDVGQYPAPKIGLEALLENPTDNKWNGPYLKKLKLPTDGWNNSFRYQLVNNMPLVISAGADTKFGTYDDIETKIRK